MQQARQAPSIELTLALLEAILGQDDRRGVNHHHASIAVNNDPIVLAHQLAGQARAHHRRNVQAAGHDRCVRGLAANIGNKTCKHALLELQHVGRRQVMRDQNQRHIHRVIKQQVMLSGFARGAHRRRHHGRAHPFHGTQDFLGDLLQVALTLTQVLVFHFVKLPGDHLQLGGQGPFGVVESVGDPTLDTADQLVVVQQHQMHVQQGGQLLRRLLGAHMGDAGLQAMDLINHRIAPTPHPINLCLNLRRRNEIVRDIDSTRCHQHRSSDGNATGDRQAMD